MRIDRDRSDAPQRASSTSALAQISATAQPAVLTFAAALHRHRQRDAARPDEAHRTDSANSRRTAARQTSPPDASRRSPANETTSERELEAIDPPPLLTSPLPPTTVAPGAAALSTLLCMSSVASQRARLLTDASGTPTGAQNTRWRQFATDAASPCLEISHSATGARFRLSRENGVWLLSFQSQIPVNVAELRAHFAASGLGPLDVLCVD